MSVLTLLLWWFRNGRPLIYFRFFRLPSHLRTLQFERSRMLQFLELLPFEMSHLPFCTEWAQTSLMKICSFLWTTTNETQVCIFLVLKCNLRSSWTFLISFNFQCLQVYNKFYNSWGSLSKIPIRSQNYIKIFPYSWRRKKGKSGQRH